jgi:hypothetical protein
MRERKWQSTVFAGGRHCGRAVRSLSRIGFVIGCNSGLDGFALFFKPRRAFVTMRAVVGSGFC